MTDKNALTPIGTRNMPAQADPGIDPEFVMRLKYGR